MATAKKALVKKATAVKAEKKADAPAWNTIHIFGYGESQVIGKNINGKVANNQLKNLAPLLSSLAEKQQKGTKINAEDLHVLNIFNGASVDFRPGSEKNKGQRFEWGDVDAKAINKLAEELLSKAPPQTAPRNFMDMLRKKSAPVAAKKSIAKKTKK